MNMLVLIYWLGECIGYQYLLDLYQPNPTQYAMCKVRMSIQYFDVVPACEG